MPDNATDPYRRICRPQSFHGRLVCHFQHTNLEDDGTVATTFRFNKGSLDGPIKEYNPRGFIRDKTSNAVWGMQFIWPFKAEYRIIYLADDYSQTVIGRSKRDYVWIMARKPSIPDKDYEQILRFLTDQGYKLDDLRKVPHRTTGSGG